VGRKRVGGFIFETLVVDHPPLHVHIFDSRGRPMGKWDIEQQRPQDPGAFQVSRRLRKALYRAGYLKEKP